MTQLTTVEAIRVNKMNPTSKNVALGDRVRALEGSANYVTGTEAQIPICGTDGVPDAKSVSGDITIDKDGAVTIGANKVDYTKLDEHGRTYELVFRRNASDTAGTDFELPLDIIPFAGTVTSVAMVGDTGIGAATNYSTVSVINKGKVDGTGTTSVASYAFDNATTHATTAFVQFPLTLSGTAANLVVAAGDVLTVKKTHSGNGQALPTNMVVQVLIERAE